MAIAGLIDLLRDLRIVRACYRAVNRLARRRWLALSVVAVLGFTASAAFGLRAVRQPKVQDEYSYLLAADTFAAGRLTNPPHPYWQHFESMHIIQQPTYAAKFPPGQGLVLALGQRLGGRPIVGVWISVAAACAAVCWLLQGWLDPRGALLGGLLAVLWLAPSYWAQSYWGGAVAACGGALLYGALPRIVRQGRWQAGFPLGIGLAILMYTRPYEGLVASLPAAAVLMAWLVRLGIRGAMHRGLLVVASTMAMLLPAAAWLATYNAAVTGNPLVMPYQVHEATYGTCPTFLWQTPGPIPAYRHPELADFHVRWELPQFLRRHSLFGMIGSLWSKSCVFVEFFIGIVFALLLLAAWRNCRDRWLWLAAASCGLVFLALTQLTTLTPHYAAPITGLVLVQVVAGMRRLCGWRWNGQRAGRWLAAAVVAGCVLEYGASLGITWYQGDSPTPRVQVARQLESDGGRHLVFVRYSPDHDCHKEWVYNRADIDGSNVVWAREITFTEDRRLRQYYAGRKAWILIADEKPPRLLAYDDPATAQYPRRPNPYLWQASSATGAGAAEPCRVALRQF